MPRRCQITGKKPLSGHNISHAHNVTNKWQKPNIQTKKIFVPELGRSVRIKLSARAMRTIDKKGLVPFLRDNNMTLDDIS